jgi:hypothetical protein
VSSGNAKKVSFHFSQHKSAPFFRKAFVVAGRDKILCEPEIKEI